MEIWLYSVNLVQRQQEAQASTYPDIWDLLMIPDPFLQAGTGFQDRCGACIMETFPLDQQSQSVSIQCTG